jgi:excisionase family DNA binding protein
MEPLLTYEQAAKVLSISQTKLKRLIREGAIPVACLGRVRRIEPSDLRAFIDAQKTVVRTVGSPCIPGEVAPVKSFTQVTEKIGGVR